MEKVLGNVAKLSVAVGAVGFYLQQAMYTGSWPRTANIIVFHLVFRVLRLSRTVEPGQRAVIFDRFAGVKPNVKGEGTKLLIPWVQTPHIFDIRITPSNIRSDTGCLSKGEPIVPHTFSTSARFSARENHTKKVSRGFSAFCALAARSLCALRAHCADLQTVGINLRVLYHPDRARLPDLYKRLGVDYAERVLPSLGNEILKQVVAQYDASELITQRELVSREIREELTQRSANFDIVLDDVAITHLSFSREYSDSIERKQVAQQEAERSKYIVLKSKQEKKAAVIK
jgi:regulator of protease activity HflC (stomatin/prohibitin superfamily)